MSLSNSVALLYRLASMVSIVVIFFVIVFRFWLNVFDGQELISFAIMWQAFQKDKGFSFKRNCVLRWWESETLK